MKHIISEQQIQHRIDLFNKVKENKTFLYIRMMGISAPIDPKSQKPQQSQLYDKKFRLKFQLSNKTSSTSFQTNNHGKISFDKLLNLREQTHLFCYQAQELLNMQLLILKEGKQNNRNKVSQHAYSRVVISPLVAMPYTRHCVKVPMVESDGFQRVGTKIVAVVAIQVFYLLKFKASLEIYPYQGNFQRSMLLGEMRLCCIFSMNGQRQKSILDEEGGIHPKWHQFAKSFDSKKFSTTKQVKKYQSNTVKFDMSSVGHTLKLDVINFPQLDKDAQIVGSADIAIASKDYLRFPEIGNHSNQTRKKIKLTFMDPHNKSISEAGEIQVGVVFKFDAKAVRLMVDSQSESEEDNQNSET